MSSTRSTLSSGSDEDTVMDQRKRKRMISNRESARRSRLRKQQHLDDLLNEVNKLKTENNQLLTKINAISEHQLKIDTENAVLRTQILELTERLKSTTNFLRVMENISGMSMDIPEIPDPLLKPWQLPCPSMPIVASAADILRF